MTDQDKTIKKLLSELQENGASIKDAKTDSELTAAALSKDSETINNFGAWVSWTESF